MNMFVAIWLSVEAWLVGNFIWLLCYLVPVVLASVIIAAINGKN